MEDDFFPVEIRITDEHSADCGKVMVIQYNEVPIGISFVVLRTRVPIVPNTNDTNNKFHRGQVVRIKLGATIWMQAHHFWPSYWHESIDGKIGYIVNDCTNLDGDESRYGVNIKYLDDCLGIHPMWLEPVDESIIQIAQDSPNTKIS